MARFNFWRPKKLSTFRANSLGDWAPEAFNTRTLVSSDLGCQNKRQCTFTFYFYMLTGSDAILIRHLESLPLRKI